ncbi:hypothetical protein [Muricoccus vinaceus]|uniref:Uncharacterized protein n=1 Tax=Muricoccus vinaceus TaxID=424704 RepID=A0ABV6ILW9_9PROT
MSRSATGLSSANAQHEGRQEERLRPGASIGVVVGLSMALWYGVYVLIRAFSG